MKILKAFVLSLMLFVLPISYASAAKKIDWNDAEITWFDYEAGVQEAEKRQAKAIVILYADWCPVCKKYSKLFKSPKVVKALDGLVMIRANVDTATSVSDLAHYDGGYVPKTIALSNNGEISKAVHPVKKDFMFYLDPKNEAVLIQFINQVKASKG